MMTESQSAESNLGVGSGAGYDFGGYRAKSNAQSGWSAAMPSSLFRYRFVKRGLDISCIVLSIPVLLPLLGLVSAIVHFNSAGPVFFSHRRICRNGSFFSMWKFRTMCVNSAEVLAQHLATHPMARREWNRTHKLKLDPRVTPVGLFLRRYSLDELPQVWNVLTGRMSLVGPRPIEAAEVEKYGDFFHYYCRVTPGVTGLWQISGRSELTYDARVKLDCDYVEHWTLWRDVAILGSTVKSVVNQDGAY